MRRRIRIPIDEQERPRQAARLPTVPETPTGEAAAGKSRGGQAAHPGGVLGLQRTVGNQAVGRLLAGQQAVARAPDKPPKKKVTVNITHLHGSSGNASSAINYANTKVYPQANIEIQKGTEVTVDEPKSKAVLGDDLELKEYDEPSAPTAEEKKLFKCNLSEGAITMYFVKKSSLGTLGEAQWPALGTGLVGFVVTNKGTDNTFSHEMGHVLLNSGDHDVPDDTYLMHATASDPTKLQPEEIAKMRASGYAK